IASTLCAAAGVRRTLMRIATRFNPARGLLAILVIAAPALADDPATRPAGEHPVALPPITIFRDAQRYCTFPDVKRLPDGRLLCVFRDAPFPERIRHIEVDARAVGAVSTDHGKTWSAPFAIRERSDCINDPSVRVLDDGRLLLTFFTWEGFSQEYVERYKVPNARRVDRGEWGAFAVPGGVHRLWGRIAPASDG